MLGPFPRESGRAVPELPGARIDPTALDSHLRCGCQGQPSRGSNAWKWLPGADRCWHLQETKPGQQPKVTGTGPVGRVLLDLQPRTSHSRHWPSCTHSAHSCLPCTVGLWACQMNMALQSDKRQDAASPVPSGGPIAFSSQQQQQQSVAGHPSASAINCVYAYPPP